MSDPQTTRCQRSECLWRTSNSMVSAAFRSKLPYKATSCMAVFWGPGVVLMWPTYSSAAQRHYLAAVAFCLCQTADIGSHRNLQHAINMSTRMLPISRSAATSGKEKTSTQICYNRINVGHEDACMRPTYGTHCAASPFCLPTVPPEQLWLQLKCFPSA